MLKFIMGVLIISALIIGGIYYFNEKEIKTIQTTSIETIPGVTATSSGILTTNDTEKMIGTRGVKVIKDSVGNNDIYDWAPGFNGEKLYETYISSAVYKIVRLDSFYMLTRARSDSYCIPNGTILHCEIPVEFRNTDPQLNILTLEDFHLTDISQYNPQYYYSYEYDTYYEQSYVDNGWTYIVANDTNMHLGVNYTNVTKRVYYNYTPLTYPLEIDLQRVGMSFMAVVDLPYTWTGNFNISMTGTVRNQPKTLVLDPTIGVSTCQNFQDMRLDLASDYYLTNNIDCTAMTSWIPIGTPPASVTFTGTLNGNNYTFHGLIFNNLNRSDNQGILQNLNKPGGWSVWDIKFENITLGNWSTGTGSPSYSGILKQFNGGGIRRVGFINVTINLDGYNVGPIAYCAGNISDVYSINPKVYTKYASAAAVGGLVGNTDSAACNISYGYVYGGNITGKASSAGHGVGGVIGGSASGGTFRYLFSSSVYVRATSSGNVGLVIGDNGASYTANNLSYWSNTSLPGAGCMPEGETGCQNITNEAWYRNNQTTVPLQKFNWTDVWYNSTGNYPVLRGIDTSSTVYPTFSDYWSDTGTLTGSGTGKFNVSVYNTNGSVHLNVNGAIVQARNYTTLSYTEYVPTSGTQPAFNGTSDDENTPPLISTRGPLTSADYAKLTTKDNNYYVPPGASASLDTYVYTNFTIAESNPSSIKATIWVNLSGTGVGVYLGLWNYTANGWTQLNFSAVAASIVELTYTIDNPATSPYFSAGKVAVIAYDNSAASRSLIVDYMGLNVTYPLTNYSIWNASYDFASAGTYVYNWTAYGSDAAKTRNLSNNNDYVVNAPGADTCTYTTGNWNVNCNDNCVITSNVDIGDNNLTISGSGVFKLSGANISNIKYLKVNGTASNPCKILVTNGGKLK